MRNLEVNAICGLCSYSCRSGCRVKVELRNNEIIGVKANLDSPYGYLCPKGKKAPEIVYSPERLLKPLIRKGPKGTICFREASWDEALDVIEITLKKLREKYGAAAICSYMGAGTLEESLSIFGDKFLQPFGSPNDMDCGSICNVSSRTLAPMTTFGLHGKNLVADLDNADTVVIWGTNPMNNSKHNEYKKVLRAKRRGAKLVVIDPRRHRLAKLVDCWIPVRPGTDGALALGIINLIIQKKWYDQNFVAHWVHGFEELKDYASLFTPELVANICRTEEAMLYQLAELFAFGNRTAVLFYTGLEYAASAVQNTRALYILWAITGNVDVEGGLYIPSYPCDLPKEEILPFGNIPIGAREYSVFYALTGKAHFVEFPKAVLSGNPYPIKALLIVGGSPYISYPQPSLWEKVYKELEFMTVTDRFMVEECKWADVVLPAATHFEIESFLFDNGGISFRKKVIEPVGDAKNDVLIIAKIAQRLGYGHLFPKNEKEILQRAFTDKQDLLQELINSPDGISLENGKRLYKKYAQGLLRKDGLQGFPTPTGKLEIKSSLLAKHGYEALPVYEDPYRKGGNSWGNSTDYPLALTTGARAMSRFNSQYLNFSELTKFHVCPELEINPKDAFPRGIQSGQKVIVRTEAGQLKFTAFVTSDICSGTVHLPHGGGGDYQKGLWKKANVNALISPENRDPISGYIACKAIPCQVEKV